MQFHSRLIKSHQLELSVSPITGSNVEEFIERCCLNDAVWYVQHNNKSSYKKVKNFKTQLDIDTHLATLKMGTYNVAKYDILNEKYLIENQTGKTLNDNQDTCPKHRFTLGIYWKSSNKCQHPEHKSFKKTSVKQQRGIRVWQLLVNQTVTSWILKLTFFFNQAIFSTWLKSHNKNLNILRTKRAF